MYKEQIGKLTLLDANLPDFNKATGEQLSFIFQQYSDKHKTIISMPKSYLLGEGKGYLAEVIELTGSHTMTQQPLYSFGVPVDETVLLISNFDIKCIKRSAPKKIPANIGFMRHHCTLPMSRINNGLDLVSQGFMISAGGVLPSRSIWRERTPIVQDKKTHKARLLTDKECVAMFGCLNPRDRIPTLMFEKMSAKMK